MSRLLRAATLRSWTRRPAQAVLAVAGVAFGVAGVVAIDLANTSATRGFELATDAVTGRASHQITGGPAGLPDATLVAVVTALGPAGAAAPVVEGWASGGQPARSLQILGIDPFSEAPFRPDLAAAGSSGAVGNLQELVTRPGAALVSADTARELTGGLSPALAINHGVTVDLGGRRAELALAAVVSPLDPERRRALDGLVVLDLASAQELLGKVGRLDRIDLRLTGPTPRQEVALARVAAVLPAGAILAPAAGRTAAMAAMTRSFRLNLRALSLLALLCGAFLIHNTATFAVVQRRPLLGTLRCLGATRQEVLGLVFREAAILGALGALLGVGLGVILGRSLVGLVTRTINDLYFVLAVRELVVAPAVLAKGALLGLGATLLAALPAALEAATVTPRSALQRSTLETRAQRSSTPLALGGLTLAGLGVAALLWPSPSLGLAFGGLFGLIVGVAATAPAATRGAMAALLPLAGRFGGTLGRLAVRGVSATLSRTGVAVAALTLAVAVTVGMGVMIDSFRQTLIQWLEGTLQADVYLSAPGPRFQAPTLEPAAVEAVAAEAGIVATSRLRTTRVNSPDGDVLLLAANLDERSRSTWHLAETLGSEAETWAALDAGAVLISEPFALRRGVAVGGRLLLTTAEGPREFPIAGVFTDYGTDQGAVLVELATYRRWWRDPSLSGLALWAAPGVDVDDLVRRARAAAAPHQRLQVRSNRALKATSLEIFDRTFAITTVLRLVAGLVAFVGVLAALAALALERERELGLLRATGLTPQQLWGLVTIQSGLLGLVAGVLALPLGLAQALAMIYVVNKRSFGWTLDLTLHPGVFLNALLLALGAALLAGVYPAWRMSQTSPARALREE